MASFKRGFCTHCHGEERTRIFGVNKDAEVCYCPHCTHAMSPKEAMGNYRWLISFHLKRASRALFETHEYLLAYQTFAHVIDVDDTIKVAYFGRLLSLVYLSTLRTSKVKFALVMHKQQSKFCHYQDTSREYFNFLWLLLDALDQYEARVLKRVTTHNIFYDTECLELYLSRLYETRQYKRYIAEEAEFFLSSNKEQFKVILERTKNAENEFEDILKQRFVTTDGSSYAFVKYNDDKPVISLREEIPLQTVHYFKPMSLYSKDNKKTLIQDQIFSSNLQFTRFIAAFVPLAIALLAVVGTGLIIALISGNQQAQLVMAILSALFLPASAALLILHYMWKNRLKKKYYNGTNPFILR